MKMNRKSMKTDQINDKSMEIHEIGYQKAMCLACEMFFNVVVFLHELGTCLCTPQLCEFCDHHGA